MAFQRYHSQHSANSEASDIVWSEGDPLYRLPYEILLHLFGFVPPREIVKVCRLVSKGWRAFFEEPAFWQLRMKQRGNYNPKLDHLADVDWAKLCLYSVHEPNLIKSFDSNGELSLKPWSLVYKDWSQLDEQYFTEKLSHGSRGGASDRQHHGYWAREGWVIEEWPKDEELLKENSGSNKNYVTTYFWCCRLQLINLNAHGFTPAIMDKVQPPIHVSEWFCARWDCGSIFKIMVALLDKDFKFLATFAHSEEMAQWEGGDLGWRKVKHVFRDYKAGVRYVLFVDGGKDTQYWAGHYGSKMAAANINIDFT